MNSQSDKESKIITSFSRHAKSYNRNAHLQRTMAERLAALLPLFLPAKTLEIGCGTGIFTRHLLNHNPRELLLNDIAAPMLEHLESELALPQKTKRLVGNAERLRFPQVQLIAGNAVVQWFEDPFKGLENLSHALVPGGSLVFSTFGPQTLHEFRETGSLHSPASLVSATLWKKHLRQANFKVEQFQSEIRKIFFPNTLAMIKNLQQIGASPLQLISATALRQLIRKYDQTFSTPQGVYSTWEMYYCSARLTE